MATAIINNYPTYTTDYAEAAQIYADAYKQVNQFSWTQQLLLPAIQAAAMLMILRYQKSQYDDIESKRIRYIEGAVSQFRECSRAIREQVENASDDVPLPAMYQPVSPGGDQWETVSEHLTMMPTLACYAADVSRYHQEQDLARAVVMNPRYYEMQEITWTSIADLMKGILPMGLVMETLTRSSERSLISGRLGRAHGQYRRDMGLTDYRVQQAARAEQRAERGSLNQDVSPLARSGDIREMIVKPTDRLGFAIQQAQLLQNSLQNAYNACARKAPFLMNLIQMEMQECLNVMQLNAGKAGLVNSYVPNYAGIFNSQVRDLSSGLVGMFGQFGNSTAGNVPAFQPQPQAPYGTVIPDYSSAK